MYDDENNLYFEDNTEKHEGDYSAWEMHHRNKVIALHSKTDLTISIKPKNWTWFEAEELPEFNWVCSRLGLRPGPLSILSAFSNAGKTFFACYLGICIANGYKLFDNFEIERPGKVLHIDWDQGEDLTRLYYWRIINGLTDKPPTYFNNISFERPEWRLDHPQAKDALLEGLKGYRLCMIDCLGASVPGGDINDDRIRSYIDMLNEVSEKTGCAILLLHHEPKATGKDPLKNVKGNGAIISAAGGSMHLTSLGNGLVDFAIGKKRFVKDLNFQYRIDDVGEYSDKLKNKIGLSLSMVSTPEEMHAIMVEPLDKRILKIIQDNPGINLSKIRTECAGRGTDIDLMCNSLHEKNFIEIDGLKPKKHTITKDGEDYLTTFGYGEDK